MTTKNIFSRMCLLYMRMLWKVMTMMQTPPAQEYLTQ
jgi:hypothetical protein